MSTSYRFPSSSDAIKSGHDVSHDVSGVFNPHAEAHEVVLDAVASALLGAIVPAGRRTEREADTPMRRTTLSGWRCYVAPTNQSLRRLIHSIPRLLITV